MSARTEPHKHDSAIEELKRKHAENLKTAEDHVEIANAHLAKAEQFRSIAAGIEYSINALIEDSKTDHGDISGNTNDGLRVQELVEAYLSDHASEWVETNDVIEHYENQLGIKIEGASARSTFSAALRRAKDKGKAERRKAPDSNRRYQYKAVVNDDQGNSGKLL